MQNNIPQNEQKDNKSKIWKIYKIISKKDANTVYIGSTKRPLDKRLSEHKTRARLHTDNIQKINWILENYDDLEILEIRKASTKSEANASEKAEVLSHTKQGYNVINIQLSINSKKHLIYLIINISLTNYNTANVESPYVTHVKTNKDMDHTGMPTGEKDQSSNRSM